LLKASGKRGAIALADEDGRIVATMKEMLFSFAVGRQHYKITRKGLFAPRYQLWRDGGGDVVASALQAPFVNRYSIECDGKLWTLKAVGLTARKFALLRDSDQVGAIFPTALNPYRETIVDLPGDIPTETQVFLTWIVARQWD